MRVLFTRTRASALRPESSHNGQGLTGLFAISGFGEELQEGFLEGFNFEQFSVNLSN